MPADKEYTFLPRHELLSFEELTQLARVFVDLGVSKIRLTGGEPLLRREIEVLVAMLSEIPGIDDLALTTNGVLLAEKAAVLKEAGLKRITVSLPSLDRAVFKKMTGLDHRVEDVLEGMAAAAAVGLGPIKVNAVVIKGVNEDGIVELARFLKREGHIVRFIEYMDVGTVNGWDPGAVLSAREIVRRVDAALPLREEKRKKASDVAMRFRYRDDGLELGAIASVTEPFCGDCSRARISADGKLYTCLFASDGHDLKSHLRSGGGAAAVEAAIREIWSGRSDRYSEERGELVSGSGLVAAPRKVEMFRIGG